MWREREIIAKWGGATEKLRATEKERKIEKQGQRKSHEGRRKRRREYDSGEKGRERGGAGVDGGGGGSRRSNIQRNVPGGWALIGIWIRSLSFPDTPINYPTYHLPRKAALQFCRRSPRNTSSRERERERKREKEWYRVLFGANGYDEVRM